MTKILIDSPIPQGIDPLVLDCIKKGENAAMPSSNSSYVSELGAKLEKLCKNPYYKKEIYCILRDTGHEIKDDESPIEIDSLSAPTINSLLFYVNARAPETN